MKRWTRVQELLGVLPPGFRPLEGKCFYLDDVKSRHSSTVLVDAISCLGGTVDSFLNKDVSCVVTSSRESWQGCPSGRRRDGTGAENAATLGNPRKAQRAGGGRQPPGPAASPPVTAPGRSLCVLCWACCCVSQERCQGSTVLFNARAWGVEVVHVDGILTKTTVSGGGSIHFVCYLTVSSSSCHTAGALKPPFLKIEDSSRKYRPLHLQSMSLPTLDHSSRFSPFEVPVPPPPPKLKEQNLHKAQERNSEPPSPPLLTASAQLIRRKAPGYCESCQLRFSDQDEHLQSEQHRRFVQDASQYCVVDQIVALLPHVFAEVEAPDLALLRLPSPQALEGEPFVDLEPQWSSDAEKVIQNLLSQNSPLQVTASPALVAPREETMEVCARSPSRTTALTNSTQREVVNPEFVAPSSAVPSSVCPASMSVGEVRTSEEESRRMEPAEDNGLPTSKVPEDELILSGSPPAGNPLSSQNTRKRSRLCSSSPVATKKRRTALQPTSDPLAACLLPADPRLAPFCHLQEPVWATLSPPGEVSCAGLVSPAGDREVVQEVAPPGDGKLYGTVREEGAAFCDPTLSDGGTSVSCLNLGVCHSAVLKEDAASGPSPSVTLGDTLEPPPAVPLSHHLPMCFKGALDPLTGTVVCSRHYPSSLGFDPHPSLLFPTGHETQDYSNPPAYTFSPTRTEAFIPDLSTCSPSSDSDWDCGLLSHVCLPATGGRCILDAELLQRPYGGAQDSSYESRLCSVLQRPDAGLPGVCTGAALLQ
ncbi:hypothetical protein GN956_G20750 [Arapaima gigas]